MPNGKTNAGIHWHRTRRDEVGPSTVPEMLADTMIAVVILGIIVIGVMRLTGMI